MAEKKAEILCLNCYHRFEVTAGEVTMNWYLNGGCPRTELSVNCPKCGVIHPRMTPDLRELLKERIEAKDYNNAGAHTVVASSPSALKRFGLI
ncbi:MAG: hypothetical protein IJE59_02090 [Clostridia bacterium]|nr:hypothetical protein [Clostridia bacterium]